MLLLSQEISPATEVATQLKRAQEVVTLPKRALEVTLYLKRPTEEDGADILQIEWLTGEEDTQPPVHTPKGDAEVNSVVEETTKEKKGSENQVLPRPKTTLPNEGKRRTRPKGQKNFEIQINKGL